MSDTERRPDTGHTPDRPDTGHTPDRPDTGATAVPPTATETLLTEGPRTRTMPGRPEESAHTWHGQPGRDLPGEPRPEEGVTDWRTGQGAPGQVWSAATAPPAQAAGGPRTGTVVLGLVLALSGIVAVVVGLGYTIDLQLAFIGLLVLAAVALLTVPLLRRRRSRPAEDGA